MRKKLDKFILEAALSLLAILLIALVVMLCSSYTTKTEYAIYKVGSASGNGYTLDVWSIDGSRYVVARDNVTKSISIAR